MKNSEHNRKIVVLDDDPTGTQTVHDIDVYTDWEYETIRQGFSSPAGMFFILTNSRSFSAAKTTDIHRLIARHIQRAACETKREYLLISRGDSTLRGHYPLETETLRQEIKTQTGQDFHGEIICPFFPEGGRYTLDDVHYVKEGDRLTPAGETEFARDKTFSYQASNLREYVAEKTDNVYSADSCISIAPRDPECLIKLMNARAFNKIIVNAEHYEDLSYFCSALVQALNEDRRFLIRSAAALPKALGDISDIPLLSRESILKNNSGNGGIVIIGSYVKKTTSQLDSLMKSQCGLNILEFKVNAYFSPGGLDAEMNRVLNLAETAMKAGKTAVIYTSRELLVPESASKDEILAASVSISQALTGIVKQLTVTPAFILAKGGITSSDVATKGLSVKKARVMGQIRKGIPVWKTGTESKFPQMPYIIFPGNVGETETLREIVEELSEGRSTHA